MDSSSSQSPHDIAFLAYRWCIFTSINYILRCHNQLRVRGRSLPSWVSSRSVPKHTDSREPELFYFTHFWSSDSINTKSKLALQPPYSTIWWEPCNRWQRATASACLFSSQTFLHDSSANQSQAQCLHFTITFGFYYIQADFSSRPPPRE